MIIKVQNFDIKQIAESGQCFRINRTINSKYTVVALNKVLIIEQLSKDTIEVDCTEEDWNNIWYEYFDLSFNYDKIIKGVLSSDDIFLINAVNFGSGIRILKQDLFETLVSFIISQRKNISAIKICIEKLCKTFGEKIVYKNTEYYLFPKPENLYQATLEQLMETGLGYRAKYIKNLAISIVNKNINLNYIKTLDYNNAINKLLELYGVGIKVANCVALFGLHKIEAFPIDVWISRIIYQYYNGNFDANLYKGYAGIIQQYMFYYVISNK